MPLKKTTVLTADDDPHLLRLVMRNLQLEGYEVLTASDGQQALEQIQAHAPDLVLLDADPLADIHNTQRINAVISNGRLLDRKELNKMLAQAETN